MITKLLAILTLSIISLAGINASALEPETEYILNSEKAFLVISTDGSTSQALVDGSISVDNDWLDLDVENVKVFRPSVDGDSGRIFGETLSGDNYYIIYDIDSENTKLFAKVWTEDKVIRIIAENPTVDLLF